MPKSPSWNLPTGSGKSLFRPHPHATPRATVNKWSQVPFWRVLQYVLLGVCGMDMLLLQWDFCVLACFASRVARQCRWDLGIERRMTFSVVTWRGLKFSCFLFQFQWSWSRSQREQCCGNLQHTLTECIRAPGLANRSTGTVHQTLGTSAQYQRCQPEHNF